MAQIRIRDGNAREGFGDVLDEQPVECTRLLAPGQQSRSLSGFDRRLQASAV